MFGYRERLDRILREEAEVKMAEASRVAAEKAEAARREWEEIQRHNRNVLEAWNRINILYDQLDVDKCFLRLKYEIWQGLGMIKDISQPPIKDSTGRLSSTFQKGTELVYRYETPGAKKYRSGSKRVHGPYSKSASGESGNPYTEVGWHYESWAELVSFEIKEEVTRTEVVIKHNVNAQGVPEIRLWYPGRTKEVKLDEIETMRSLIDDGLLRDAVYRTKNGMLPSQLRDKAQQEISEMRARIALNTKWERSFWGKLLG